MPKPLHPNLAKLAASYDEIIERYSIGRVTAAEAHAEIATLVARDDDGILWSINPDDGAWMRRTRGGDLVVGTPPSYGLATPTPHDISTPPTGFSPTDRIQSHEVKNELLYSPSEFAGSTRRPRQPIPEAASGALSFLDRFDSPIWGRVIIGTGLAALVLAVGMWVVQSHGHHVPVPAPTPTTHVAPAVIDAPLG